MAWPAAKGCGQVSLVRWAAKAAVRSQPTVREAAKGCSHGSLVRRQSLGKILLNPPFRKEEA